MTDSKNPSYEEAAAPVKPQQNLLTKAELKLKRERDASQAMKEHLAEREATLAKTARLRAARLALAAETEAVAERSKKKV